MADVSRDVEAVPAAKASVGNPLAVVLWVVVGSGLIYGISQTAITAVSLFTG